MDNNNLCDMMNRAQGIVKACNIANTVDSTISELNWAINSNRIEDKTNELKKMFAQCGSCICQAKNIHALAGWVDRNHYFEQKDASVYDRDLMWLRDVVIPEIAKRQLCNMMAEKVTEDRLKQMGCPPQLLLMIKAMLGQ